VNIIIDGKSNIDPKKKQKQRRLSLSGKTLQPENTVAQSGSIRSSALPSCEMSHLVYASQPTQQHHNAVAARKAGDFQIAQYALTLGFR